MGGSGIGERVAPAITDDPDIPRLRRGGHCRLNIDKRILQFGARTQIETLFHIIRRIAEFDIPLDAIENRRSDGKIAGSREGIRSIANVTIDAEDLLKNNDAAARTMGGLRLVSADR